jgi:hypothetical protein
MAYTVPDQVRAFVRQHLRAYDQLEVLMLVRSAPQTEWTVSSVFKVVQSTRELVEERLEGFVRAGFLAKTGSNTYRYAPRTEALRQQIAELAEAYHLGRHHLIELIYAPPPDPLQGFSDAFKFKRNP